MAFRAVLLDWGGTIAREGAVRPEALGGAVAACLAGRFGHAVPPAAVVGALRRAFAASLPGRSFEAPRLEAVLADALRDLGLESRPEVVEAVAERFAEAEASGQRVYDDARALLGSLRYRGYAMAVVTNSLLPARLFARRAVDAGLAAYFGAIVTSADAGFGKPHPAPYRTALAALGVATDEALFVGDREDTDIAGARALGIPALRLNRRREGVDRAAGVIGALTGVQAWLGEGMPA